MRPGYFGTLAIALPLMLAAGSVLASETTIRCPAENDVVERAVKLLPRRLTARVIVIDPDLAGDAVSRLSDERGGRLMLR
jgi:hypothetical protein